MRDFFKELHNEPEDDNEPSFSFADFREWLARQGDGVTEQRQERKTKEAEIKKEAFKKRCRERFNKRREG